MMLRSAVMLAGRIPMIKYVCCDCGYVEEWIEGRESLKKLEERYV